MSRDDAPIDDFDCVMTVDDCHEEMEFKGTTISSKCHPIEDKDIIKAANRLELKLCTDVRCVLI